MDSVELQGYCDVCKDRAAGVSSPPPACSPGNFLDMLAYGAGIVDLSLKTDRQLTNIVRGIDPYSWQWRHRPAIVALLHELADRLDVPKQISVTELCADHPNLAEYVRQMEAEIAQLKANNRICPTEK